MRIGRVVRLSVVTALSALAVGACKSNETADAAEANSVVTVKVGKENVVVVEQAELKSGPGISGSLAPRFEATVRAEVGGAVLQTFAEQGQAVRKGALLARIDETGLRDAFLSARAAVRTAEQSATVARRNEERSAALAGAGAIADRDLEMSKLSVSSAESQLADARSRFAMAQQQLTRTEIRAPLSGVVSDRPVSAGDVVQPGAALFTVVDPSRMKLEASVRAEELSQLRAGAPVEFSVNGYPGRTFTGQIARVNPVADPATRQVRITVEIPNTGGQLVAGLFAEGRVASETRSGLVVPVTAVDVRGLQPSVTRIRNGKAEKVTVALGLRDEATERLEIRSGVAAGDTLLLGAAQGIAPGTPVSVSTPADTRTASP
ncbi:MAG: efflux RND transporter periplasmic adaptor subunit [Gemmatimonadaceae bacterium]|nr:efflux RND transporter periplasmic adaptor subunit [Gemmatimonadaceae bacterium]MDQ3520562.1 efflux RND transporter periplasmic adaptor subunit [Gemmatimonadota bacterium]